MAKLPLTVLSMASEITPGFKVFADTCDRFGIEPVVFGMGVPFGGLSTKPKKLQRALRSIKGLVLFADSYDVAIAGTVDDILERYYKIPKKSSIVFAAEKRCFPVEPWLLDYPPCPTPWKYLNCGGIIGQAEELIELMERAGIQGWHNMQNDQLYFTHAFLFGQNHTVTPPPVSLDYNCELFQCLWDTADQIDYNGFDKKPCIINKVTGTKPVVMHANGVTDPNGVDLKQTLDFLEKTNPRQLTSPAHWP
jgi:hypothetical protein